MNPIIYACCQTEDRLKRSEAPYRLEWSTVAPQLGTVISMGAQARWSVVKITVYRPETAQTVASIYLVYVHPEGLSVPPDSEWDNDFIMDSEHGLYLEVVAIGEEELALGALGSSRIPKVGDQVESDVDPMDADIIIYDPPKFWTMRQVVSYSPVMEMRLVTSEEINARAFLCWCEPTEVTSAS
ncbi:MAG: hypothetical protein KME42_08695 [Tildeniella nuda ZEHNDER 1965/U140]|jgi:hypothetical protein|nr:hypothetical protein [Tildeniella nuda ZEHNDER 1965/U140]